MTKTETFRGVCLCSACINCQAKTFFIFDFSRFSNDFCLPHVCLSGRWVGWLVDWCCVLFFWIVLLVTMFPTIFDCCNLQLWKKPCTHIHNIHYYDYWCNSEWKKIIDVTMWCTLACSLAHSAIFVKIEFHILMQKRVRLHTLLPANIPQMRHICWIRLSRVGTRYARRMQKQ